MRRSHRWLFSTAVCIPIGSYSQALAAPMFTGLGDLPGGIFNSLALGVSNDGKAIAGASDIDGNGAFRWTANGGMVALGDLPGGIVGSFAYDISADGAVVVGSSRSSSGERAFRWTEATGMVPLSGGVQGSLARGVSGDGSAIAGVISGNGGEAFRWTETTGMVGLGDLSGGSFGSYGYDISENGSVVVGQGSSLSGTEAFRWTSDTGMIGLGDLSGGIFSSIAFGVSSDGAAAVGISASAFGTEAFRWTAEDGMVGLGDLPGGAFESYAYGASADGSVVVGFSRTAVPGHEAFIWDEVNGMRLLSDVLVEEFGLDLSGWTLSSAYAISADGLTIVGRGVNPDGFNEAWVAAIPEPSTGLLLGAGLLGLAAVRRRVH